MDGSKKSKMNRVFLASDNIVSPLGLSTADNYIAVKEGKTGIALHHKTELWGDPFYASLLASLPAFENHAGYTRFERMCILSIQNALSGTSVRLDDKDTVFILSTTKGNISLLTDKPVSPQTRSRIALHSTAKTVAAYFNAVNMPLVISNACISGVLAVLLAKRLLKAGKYKHAVVTGADELSYFIMSGFRSLHAVSNEPCKPFDKKRDGITLGEGAATMILTTDESLAACPQKITIGDGVSTNDANHISGPSRTGAELGFAVAETLKQNHLQPAQISFISAHGTATVYNDEMESKAFESAQLADVPLHSLKGHFGHTLGAAGVIESLITIYSLRDALVLPNMNYDEYGVSGKVNISRSVTKTGKHYALKTASGFGGCNASIVYSSIN
jgi:3-oxoacyl-[acyl-carrier-protein] synthase-1